MNNTLLPTDTEEKDVCITFDNTWKCRYHKSELQSRPYQTILFETISIQKFNRLYKPLGGHYLNYAAWSGIHWTDEYETEKVQRRTIEGKILQVSLNTENLQMSQPSCKND